MNVATLQHLPPQQQQQFYRKIMVEVHTKFFGIISENESLYLAQLKGVLESVDEFSSIQITKTPSDCLFRIVPSMPKYTNNIITALTQFHNTLNVKLHFSKSIKTSGAISFKVSLN